MPRIVGGWEFRDALMHSEKKPIRRRWWPAWLGYFVLFAVAIPWYWPAGSTAVWLGIPAWAVVALAASVAISALTAGLLLCPWEGESRQEGPPGER